MTSQPPFSPEVILKAERLLGAKTEDGQPKLLRDTAFPGIWWVTPSSGETRRYRVQTDWTPEQQRLSYVTCTCPHGMAKGGGTSRCYHVAAVLMSMVEIEQGKVESKGEDS